ncbi:hypothetical protein COW36_12180 [bacterium (Candidatus Blackallbacteria) CG17_big_fil_post_rev_8_21_14_2_50_48_46]|uniref:Flagellar Assembly Protein A N-terminal region domain-containing protein n=1 Tax=bacterium (Candidatus Blackallbacteria) CG17_big_fil_post_rev_8_21_14_2_50_48_46 TaxID=2014261 RepID=A0A2M7G3W9_9BACT|nr:MAG: hypothetical protein COW64_03080 [bacterium (Candidatus Blackallbacteria) CG18_big_fil_WC_8_21_14_2_50_49_26]PIW16517.1 MAG: hypothetical protein COW36_12180 [bacterium (Candidatus Blackallbacteria) CG17_big_fil_post_rev_8_21_14_2_50_48_46]PIW46025.1 MAG: hypothetical protein COW20_17445 [bacterium (Candidatus Blackallbacteria) CG13_big_fil_rev_8_21_14_2_50_49_14]
MSLSFEHLGSTVLARWEPVPGADPPQGSDLRDFLEEQDFLDFFLFEEIWESFLLKIYQAPQNPLACTIAEARPYQLDLELSKDRMQAWISLTPAYGGQQACLDDLILLLREQRIVYGVLPDILERLIQSEVPVRLLVAQGELPVDGEDAYFEALVEEPPHSGQPLVLSDQRVDFHNLQLMKTVEMGVPLMRRHPPSPGKPGMNLLKRQVPQKKGHDLPFGPSRGAEVAAHDSNLLISSIPGRIRVRSNTVYVEPVFHVAEIGASTGDIYFPGTVLVDGTVFQGYALEALGDILVDGTIEAAWIKSQGHLLARQGMVGNRNSRIVAGQNLESRFIEHSQVLALDSVSVSDIVIHSQVHARNEVKVGFYSGKGQIAGGVVSAGKRIQARIAGSPSNTKTYLKVGMDPVLETQEILLKKRLEYYRQKLDRVGESLVFARVRQNTRELLSALEALREQLLLRVNEISEQLSQIPVSSHTGKIIITDHIYAGVTVTIGGYSRYFDQDFSGATLYVDSQKQEIAIGSVRL